LWAAEKSVAKKLGLALYNVFKIHVFFNSVHGIAEEEAGTSLKCPVRESCM
jgi:hypothetical protein